MGRKRLCFITTVPMAVSAFLRLHIERLADDYDVFVITNYGAEPAPQDERVTYLSVPLARQISPFLDLKTLFQLVVLFHRHRFEAVHSITPKAGLLGVLAALMARVPVRVHTFTGQVWVTRQGPMRWLLKAADQCIAALATDVLVDSPSQRDFLIQEGVVSAQGSAVVGEGSICGVDTQRFSPSPLVRQQVRADMGSSADVLVCLYLGRLNRDKGVLDLAAAFVQVADKHPKAELWVVGPDEDGLFPQMQTMLGACGQQVRRVGYTNEPERFMQAADLFCLPSYLSLIHI